MPAIDMDDDDFGFPKSDATLAVMSRMCIRKHRNTGSPISLDNHKRCRDELERRGYTEQFGEMGWDDANSSPDRDN